MKAQSFRLNLLAVLILLTLISARAAPPVVSNVRAQQRAGTQYVDIFYNVSDPDGDSPLRVRFEVSADGGAGYTVPVFSFSGAVGANVLPGNDRLIVWNAGADWPGQFTDRCRVRVIADDGRIPPVPPNMALIPAGEFQMGNNYSGVEGETDEVPVHTVFVSAFWMDKYEVSKELWDKVVFQTTGRGYAHESSGSLGQLV
jgi:hypothetical protein